MSNKNQSSSKNARKIQLKDANRVVVLNQLVDGVVKSKQQSLLVIQYQCQGESCSGVLHVSRLAAYNRTDRDVLFGKIQVGDKLPGLKVVGVVPPAGDRHFTSVTLSALEPLKDAQEEQRKARQAARQAREAEKKAVAQSLNGSVVSATVKQLAFSMKDGAPTDHVFGAFVETEKAGHRISGLLHVSRMHGGNGAKVDRLAGALETREPFKLVLSITETGQVSFSELDVKDAELKAAQAAEAARKATEAEKALTVIREAIASGTAENSPFLAKVTVNLLEQNGGVEAEFCGLRVLVSSEDLAIRACDMKGKGHTIKLVALEEKGGVISARRYIKTQK